jgi:hypothetical protein
VTGAGVVGDPADVIDAVGGEAIERSATDGTLAPDVTADDIAYQLLGLVRIVQLISRAGTGHHRASG